MREYLEKDVHIFSALKTHAQLTEARQLLLDNGKVRSYESFEQNILKINNAYNRDYLEAEYLFAVSSAQSAANWANLQDDNDRYWLEYRTAGDNRVRPEHQSLHGICLPKNDPFWMEFYPPNGWRCRCVAVEVLAVDYTKSDSDKSIKKGKAATTQIGKSGKNTLEIFRFNPGIEKKIFPPNNTYSKVVGAEKVIKDVNPKKINRPEGLEEIEKKYNVKIPEEQLNLLKNSDFKFTNSNRLETAHFHSWKQINVNDKDMSRASDLRRKQVLVHELGHAIDHQYNFANSKEIKDLMQKYRDKFSQNKNAGYKRFNAIVKRYKNAPGDDGTNVHNSADILKSLNNKLGYGHSTAYFNAPLKSEREFIAHCFENKFVGNHILQQIDPELYQDMIDVIDKLKK